MELTLPDFSNYEPVKLKKKCLDISEGFYEFDDIRIDIEEAIRKLKSNQRINIQEIVALSNDHKLLINECLVDVYYKEVNEAFLKMPSRKKRSILKILLYEFEFHYDVLDVYNNLADLFNSYQKDIVRSVLPLPLLTTWEATKEQFVQRLTSNNLEQFLGEVTKMTSEVMSEIFIKKELKDSATKHLISTLDQYTDHMLAPVVDAFLSSIKSETPTSLKVFQIKLLKAIKEKVKVPDTNRMFWNSISQDSVNYYNRWLMLNKMYSYFDQLSVPRMDRLEFWKQYFKDFRNLEFYKEYAQALVIETDEHTFVEFNGSQGGKFHIFRNEFLNIDKINEFKKGYRSRSYITNKVLKDEEHSIYDERHNGNWQIKFKRALIRFGYYVGGSNGT